MQINYQKIDYLCIYLFIHDGINAVQKLLILMY